MIVEQPQGVWDWNKCLRGASLSLSVRAVAYTLGTYADSMDGSSAHPGNERLMRDTGASESTVRRALIALVAAGWIELVSVGSRGRGASEYQLTIPVGHLAKLGEKRLLIYENG